MLDLQILKAFRNAIKDGNTGEVERLLAGDSSLLSATTPFGKGLHIAAAQGKLPIVQVLLEHGANIDERGGILEASPLLYAASGGHLDVVKHLIERGAAIDITEPGRNPLFGAIYGNHIDVARYLIETCRINTSVKYSGETMTNMDALGFALEWGRSEIADMLRKKR